MLKFNCFILTVTLSVFSVVLLSTENQVSILSVNNSHDIKFDHTLNAMAISTNNLFLELFSFDNQKNNNPLQYLESYIALNKLLFNTNTLYLKACDFINLTFTASEKIYPFHSFL